MPIMETINGALEKSTMLSRPVDETAAPSDSAETRFKSVTVLVRCPL